MELQNELLGFIGLGAMGQGLARRILSHGFKVIVLIERAVRPRRLRQVERSSGCNRSTRTGSGEATILRFAEPTAKVEDLPRGDGLQSPNRLLGTAIILVKVPVLQ